jgi:hypothetical protein
VVMRSRCMVELACKSDKSLAPCLMRIPDSIVNRCVCHEDRTWAFPGFSTLGCNRITGVQAKLGPIGGLRFRGRYKSAGGLNPPPHGRVWKNP